MYRYTTAGVLHQCTLDDSPFGSGWELQLRLSEVTVPTGLLEYTYFERRHVMNHTLGERLASPRLWEVPVEDGDVLPRCLMASPTISPFLSCAGCCTALQTTPSTRRIGSSTRPTPAAARLATREPRSTTSPLSLSGFDSGTPTQS